MRTLTGSWTDRLQEWKINGTVTELWQLANFSISSIKFWILQSGSYLVTLCLENTQRGGGMIYISLLSGLLIKSGSDSSLSEEDELKCKDSGKKETEAQVEEKESCSDEEKNKEGIGTEVEQRAETGMAL